MARKDKGKEKSRQWNIIGKYYNFKKINKGAIKNIEKFKKEMLDNEVIPENDIGDFKSNVDVIIADINEERFSIWEELKNLNNKFYTLRSGKYLNALCIANGIAAYYSNSEYFAAINNNFPNDITNTKVPSKNIKFFRDRTIDAIKKRIVIEGYNDSVKKLYDKLNGTMKCFYGKDEIEKLENGKIKAEPKKTRIERIESKVYYSQILKFCSPSVDTKDATKDYYNHNDMSKRQLSNNNGLSNQNNPHLPKNFNPISNYVEINNNGSPINNMKRG